MGKKKKKKREGYFLFGGASKAHKGDRMYQPQPTVYQPPQPKAERVDLAMFNVIADVWRGRLQDIAFADCVKPLTIVMTPSGLAEVRRFSNFWAVRGPEGKVDQIMPVDGKMPEAIFLDIWAFFRAVYEKYKSEAIVFVWQNDETHEWKITVPTQRVSSGSVNAERPDPESDRPWRFWGEVHSHQQMSAFFSGTDDSSERAEGFYFGVLGKVAEKVDYKFRVKCFGSWHLLDPIAHGEVMLPEVPAEWLSEVSEGHTTGFHGNYQGYNGQRVLGSHCGGGSVTPMVRVVDRDTTAVGVSQQKVILKNGYVAIKWADGVVTETNTKAEYLSESEQKLALREGVDWHDHRGAAAADAEDDMANYYGG